MTKKIRFTSTLPDHLVARLADIQDHKGLTRNGLINHVLSEYAREYWATAPQPENPQGHIPPYPNIRPRPGHHPPDEEFNPSVCLIELPQYKRVCTCGPGGTDNSSLICSRQVGTQCRLHSHGGTPRGYVDE
jgi:hypothetical protein